MFLPRFAGIKARSGNNCSFKNMPCLDVVVVNVGSFHSDSNDKVTFCKGIDFSQLIELKLQPEYSDNHWMESLVHLLHNSLKLRVLMIDSVCNYSSPLFSNQPSSVPECLLSHLEIFEWEGYEGEREEKKFLAYILANSKNLKTVGISPIPFYNENRLESERELKEELKSMYRILSQIPTKDAVTTMILSKRWRFVWTMVHNLDYEETDRDKKSIWDFVDKSLQLHKAPILERLSIQLGEHCPVYADVGKCVSHAIEVRELYLECVNLYDMSLPKRLYKCETLVKLTLGRPILVDVPSSVALCNGTNFSRLMELKLWPKFSDNHWLEPLMHLLHNSPKLRALKINTDYNNDNFSPLLWNEPSSVPGCMLSHLEFFEWIEYRGRRAEKELLAYILANSMCLKTVEISTKSWYIPDENSPEKMKDELESMYRASTSSQLMFSVDRD
ncbi:hypothetical protein AALP_AA3G116700 [Arabis alpina]|uniref:FBD domain-containing protein n=1 Tax=Arabis alpina TaxID=50452 RepID=A0A087H8L6_ARAAL|nr:hypothetical protein AALP_AA3G116700 [Arabis alpina]